MKRSLSLFTLILFFRLSVLGAVYTDYVLPYGNGSGVIINDNRGLTARHVLKQMQFDLGSNIEDLCCGEDPTFIKNSDSYTWTFIPGASEADKRSLLTGRIDFNNLNKYNDWSAIGFSYHDREMPLKIGDITQLPSGSPLVAVGHLNFKKYVNSEIQLISADSKTIEFSYKKGSAFGPGFSGGGLFTPDGTLVGVIFAMEERSLRGAATNIIHIKDEVTNSCAAQFSGLIF